MSNRLKYKHVALIGIDGMGSFNRVASTPRMDEIFESGAVTYNALSMNPTISAENWGAMLLGANPTVHELTNGIVSNREYTNTALPSVFSRIRNSLPDAYLASCCNWDPINNGIIEHGIGVDFCTADSDELLAPMIVERVAKKPMFLFVQFDDVDHAGHHSTYGSEEYLASITKADMLVGQVYDAYKTAGILDDTLFIVIADHGGIRNGHGGYTDSEKYIFLGVCGRDVMCGSIGYACTKDISAVVLYALGLEYPEYDLDAFSSQLPFGIFPETGHDYFRAQAQPSPVFHMETPAFKAENGLSAFLAEDRIKLALFFDNNLEDATGKHLAKEKGLVKYYGTGVSGSFAEFGKTGHAVYSDVKIGAGGFSVAVWLKIDRSLIEAPALCGNKDWWWQNRRRRGFELSLRCADTLLNIGCGDDDVDFITPFPEDVSDGWIHAIYTVDIESREMRCYYNFRLAHTAELETQFLCDLNSELPFTVGDDALGKYNCETHDFLVHMDDFLLLEGALTLEEINSLARYYGK